MGTLSPVSETTSSLGSLAHLDKATYDPNNIQSDVFNMDNMVEGTNTKIMTSAERTTVATIPSPSALDYIRGNSGGTSFEVRTADQVLADLGPGAVNPGISTTGGTTTLTVDDFRYGFFPITGTLTSDATIVIPDSLPKRVEFLNNTTGDFSVYVKHSATAGSGIELPRGLVWPIRSDGTTAYDPNSGSLINKTSAIINPSSLTTSSTTYVASSISLSFLPKMKSSVIRIRAGGFCYFIAGVGTVTSAAGSVSFLRNSNEITGGTGLCRLVIAGASTSGMQANSTPGLEYEEPSFGLNSQTYQVGLVSESATSSQIGISTGWKGVISAEEIVPY